MKKLGMLALSAFILLVGCSEEEVTKPKEKEEPKQEVKEEPKPEPEVEPEPVEVEEAVEEPSPTNPPITVDTFQANYNQALTDLDITTDIDMNQPINIDSASSTFDVMVTDNLLVGGALDPSGNVEEVMVLSNDLRGNTLGQMDFITVAGAVMVALDPLCTEETRSELLRELGWMNDLYSESVLNTEHMLNGIKHSFISSPTGEIAFSMLLNQ